MLQAMAAVGAVMATAASGRAQAAPDPGPRMVLEAGVAGQRAVSGGLPSWGGSLAAEITPAAGWPEFEVGVAAVGGPGEHEVSADIVGMKSWDLSPTLEFMLGVGPEAAWHAGTAALNVEAIVHVMYWPRSRVGLFVEPAFSYGLGRGGERSIGITAGALFRLL